MPIMNEDLKKIDTEYFMKLIYDRKNGDDSLIAVSKILIKESISAAAAIVYIAEEEKLSFKQKGLLQFKMITVSDFISSDLADAIEHFESYKEFIDSIKVDFKLYARQEGESIEDEVPNKQE
jgi:hypothetical protein